MRGILPGDSGGNNIFSSPNIKTPAQRDPEVLKTVTFSCEVCGRDFDALSFNPVKAKSETFDIDLRPKFSNVDVTLYKIVECPFCGYAGIDKFYSNITERQSEALARVCDKTLKIWGIPKERNYANVFPIYKDALRCALAGGLETSKRAYIALYSAWFLRGWREDRERQGITTNPEDIMGSTMEYRFLNYAHENFLIARCNESFPICGMDETTFDYLIAALSYKTGNLKEASRLVEKVHKASTATPVIKRMSEELLGLLKSKP